MKEFLIKNKLKFMILLFLILFFVLIFNINNIYNLLKGNTLINYEIVANVEGHESITADKKTIFSFVDNSTPIFKYTKDKKPDEYIMNVTATFQANVTNSKKIKLTLKPGIYLIDNGAKTFGESNGEPMLIKAHERTGFTKLEYAEIGYTNAPNQNERKNLYRYDGTLIYELNPKSQKFSFNIKLSLDPAFEFSEIEDAITIELIEDDVSKKVVKKTVELDYSEIPITINGNSNINTYGANNEIHNKNLSSYNLSDNLMGLSSFDHNSRTVFYNYIQFFVETPDYADLIGTRKDGLNVGTVGYEFRSESLPNNDNLLQDEIIGGTETFGVGEEYHADNGVPDTYINILKKGNKKIYIFTIKNSYNSSYGVIPIWNFYGSEDIEFDNNRIAKGAIVKGLKVKYQVYGGEHREINFPLEKLNNKGETINITSINKFEMIDHEIIVNGYSNGQIYSYDEKHPDDEIHLGTYRFLNKSPIPSKAKDIFFGFDPDFGVSSIVIPLMGNGRKEDGTYDDLMVSYKVKGDNTLITKKVPVTEYSRSYIHFKHDLFKLSKEMLGLTKEQYIGELTVHNMIIPEYYETKAWAYYNCYYGKVLDDSNPKKRLNFSIKNANKDNDNDYEGFSAVNNNAVTETLKSIPEGEGIKYLTAGPSLGTGNPGTINSSGYQHFSFQVFETLEKEGAFFRRTYNPIIYIRSEPGLPLKNFVLKNTEYKTIDGKVEKIHTDLLEKYKDEVKITSEEKDGTIIYKIDTTNVPSSEAFVGITSHFYDRNKFYKDYRLYLEFDMDIPVNYNNPKTNFKYSDMIFVTSLDSNDVKTYTPQYRKGDMFDVDSDGITTNDVMSYMNVQGSYQIALSKDFHSIIKQKQSTETEYKEWQEDNDNIYLSNTNTLDLRLEIQNNSGENLEENNENDDAFLFIPIPKKGENWGELSKGENSKENKPFDLTLELLNYLNIIGKENITYEIYYGLQGKVIPKIDNNELLKINLSELIKEEDMDKELLKKVNIVVIKIKGLKNNEKISIDMKMGLLKIEYQNVLKQQFRYTLYRNLITSDNQERSGFVLGNTVGVTNELSKYNLTVFHKDIYDKILDVENYEKTYNEEYETLKKDFENYEIFLEPENAKGIIKEDTTVTYVYKSILDRKVIVHFYEKGTKNKLIEDKILIGKDLEGFKIKPEEIKGYKVVDGKEINGSFKEEVQEFIYEYEKEIIIIPSTLDNIISSIIIFIVSIISIILVIVYVRKKKKFD